MIREAILRVARRQKTFASSDVLAALSRGVPRQYVTAVLRKLVEEGSLVKAGSTKGATYALLRNASALHPVVRRRLKNVNLREDEVLDDIRRSAPFLTRVPANVRDIFAYAFLEMLNNAIEHSKSPVIEVDVSKVDHTISFVVNDFGIGVFRNVMGQRSLGSEVEAAQDLMKGKTTTQPHAHSGEGIFFTSRAADLFVLESFKHRLRADNVLGDHFIESTERMKQGTRVTFRVAQTTTRQLRDVFEKFSATPSAPSFDQTEVKVRLFALGTPYVSRSQARRLLIGLEKFKAIVLDFDRVPTVGQGFVDEIFRVFKSQHPEIVVTPTNMNEPVRFMIERALRTER